MSLFSQTATPLRLAFLAIIAAVAMVVTGCSGFVPAYSGRLAETGTLELAYGEPRDRLEQIIHQELALTLGTSDAPSAPLVRTSVTSQETAEGLSATQGPQIQQITLFATLTISPRDSGTDTISLNRTTSTSFTRSGQGLADQEARIDAEDRAARALAQSLRLAVLAALPR